MDLDPAIQSKMLEFVEELASVSGDLDNFGIGKLNIQQRQFACAFVLTGGDATAAATAAGYAHPAVAGHKARLNPKVSELIRVLALADAGSALPIAIATLRDIAMDKSAKPETRRNAALDLAKIANALPSSAAQVAVQVNAGGAAGDGAQPVAPSVVIQNVWSNREARLSGIAPPMLDSDSRVIDGSARAPDDEGGGG